jgi:hypothetical protein
MDDVLTGALEIVRDHGVGNAELWFNTIRDAYQELDESEDGATFDGFRQEFAKRAGMEGYGDAADEFVRYADGNGGLDLVRRLSDEGTGNLVNAYEELLAEAESDAESDAEDGLTGEADDADEAADEEYDPDAWNAFLVEYAANWNGEDDTWDQFKEWFLHYAGEQGFRSPASDFMDYVGGESDKIAVFAQYGVTIGAADDGATDSAEGAEDEEASTEAWNAFLAEYGAGWNGEDDTWDQFKEWFLHYAAEQSLTSVATGFIEYADGESDKVALFAQYGVTIGAAGGGDEALEGVAALFDEEAVAEAIQKVEAAAAASPAVADDQVGLVSDAFADVLTEAPEAAGLSEAMIQQLIDEVAAEHL